ncbi:MAG TPA: transposase [Candidatus Paceibacterota bacterium]
MVYRRTPFAEGEWYHCYSRGVDKRIVFDTERDYQRFQQTLYLANNVEDMQRDTSEQRKIAHADVFTLPRKAPIVAIAAYALLPNHFHLLLKEITEGGITRFMRKLGTSYTMYFNIKNKRVGNLFLKPFRSKHVSSDQYFHVVPQYIHLNAAEYFEADWKRGSVRDAKKLERELLKYAYCSLPDYYGSKRVEGEIVNKNEYYGTGDLPSLPDCIADAVEYYAELENQR